MAKPLGERIASARSTDRVTITDLQALITEAREEQARQTARKETAEADACDIALSEGDREDAAAAAASAGRLIKAYGDAIAELEEKLERKNTSEKRQAEEAEKAAAIAERDDIAARFKAAVPDAAATIAALCEEVLANDKRLKKAGLRGVENAELSARGLKSGGYVGYSPALKFTEMRIPNWDRAGHAWPKRQRQIGIYDEAGHRQRAADNIANAKAQWGFYRLTLPPPKDPGMASFETGIPFVAKMPIPINSARRKLLHDNGPWEGDLEHVEAERLRGLGVLVEQLEVDDARFAERLKFYV